MTRLPLLAMKASLAARKEKRYLLKQDRWWISPKMFSYRLQSRKRFRPWFVSLQSFISSRGRPITEKMQCQEQRRKKRLSSLAQPQKLVKPRNFCTPLQPFIDQMRQYSLAGLRTELLALPASCFSLLPMTHLSASMAIRQVSPALDHLWPMMSHCLNSASVCEYGCVRQLSRLSNHSMMSLLPGQAAMKLFSQERCQCALVLCCGSTCHQSKDPPQCGLKNMKTYGTSPQRLNTNCEGQAAILTSQSKPSSKTQETSIQTPPCLASSASRTRSEQVCLKVAPRLLKKSAYYILSRSSLLIYCRRLVLLTSITLKPEIDANCQMLRLASWLVAWLLAIPLSQNSQISLGKIVHSGASASSTGFSVLGTMNGSSALGKRQSCRKDPLTIQYLLSPSFAFFSSVSSQYLGIKMATYLIGPVSASNSLRGSRASCEQVFWY